MFSLIYIRDLIVFTLFFIYRRIYPPPSASQVIVPTRTLLSNSGVNCRRAIPLPQETLEHIFFLHIASLVDSLQCETVQDYRVRKSHLLSEIAAVARCSKRFHAIMRGCLSRIWASCGLGLGLCSQKVGPGTADRPARYIWIITAEQGCLPLNVDLAVHIMLKIASINYHDGVQWSKNQQGFRRLRCVRAYPRSLRQLEILRSHTPEEEVINLVSDCCPGLTELRLGRCTMFNDPKCWYWRTHTRNQDHDYMKTWDPAAVVDYANDMALLLCRLPQLEAIHIGHYLIDINAVLTHRLDPAHGRHHPIVDRRNHIDGAMTMSVLQFMANADEGPPINPNGLRLADKELWITPCPQCETEFKQLIEDAERRAAGIMAAHFRHLKHVSFANFLSGGRVTPSSWLVGRQERGPDLYVRTEDPSRPRRSRMMQPMVHVGNRWEPLPTA